MSRAISSIKMKSTKDTFDCELKFYDKLKAIELYFKLEDSSEANASDGTLYIDYDYVSVEDES